MTIDDEDSSSEQFVSEEDELKQEQELRDLILNTPLSEKYEEIIEPFILPVSL